MSIEELIKRVEEQRPGCIVTVVGKYKGWYYCNTVSEDYRWLMDSDFLVGDDGTIDASRKARDATDEFRNHDVEMEIISCNREAINACHKKQAEIDAFRAVLQEIPEEDKSRRWKEWMTLYRIAPKCPGVCSLEEFKAEVQEMIYG